MLGLRKVRFSRVFRKNTLVCTVLVHYSFVLCTLLVQCHTQLFKSSRTNVLEHIQHIYEVEELEKEATCRNFRQVRQEGKRMVNRTMTMYNLDMIISVGYRVNSKRGVKFRQWANKIIKDYLIKGYAINDRIRKEQIGELRQLVEVASRAISNQEIPQTVES